MFITLEMTFHLWTDHQFCNTWFIDILGIKTSLLQMGFILKKKEAILGSFISLILSYSQKGS